jgi:hypothetical protein
VRITANAISARRKIDCVTYGRERFKVLALAIDSFEIATDKMLIDSKLRGA